MKILIINWRSIKDPLEGGAERATFENAKRWVKNHKDKVTWLSPKYDRSIDSETIEGVNFQYIGFPLTRNLFQLIFTFPIFYFLVFWTYMIEFKGKVDVVIDQVHGIPYLTPLYVKEKIIVYIHEVAGEIWDLMYPFPINKIGKLIEKLIFLPYKKVAFVGAQTVTKELPLVGIPAGNIHTVSYGVTAPKLSSVPTKNKDLTVVYVNRLVKMKGPERALLVFKEVLKKDKNAKLIMSGKGDLKYIGSLIELVKNMKMEKSVKIVYLSDEEKYETLRSAHVIINSSYKEGWGLINIEANCFGTPVVAFKVKGNTESVSEGVSGFLFESKDIKKMAKKIVELKNNTRIRQSTLEYSKQFDWDKVSNQFYEILTN